MAGDDDGFLARWSRRKALANAGEPLPPEAPSAPAAAQGPAPTSPAAPEPEAPPPPTLADAQRLLPGDEVRRFLAHGVDETVKRAALKKLFADPHFNVMDGLDTYIDDYGQPDPIPLAMLRQLNQARGLGLFDDDGNALPPPNPPARDLPPAATTDGAPPPALSESDDAPAPGAEPASHEDADLQLQPDDAARQRGAGEGAGS